MNALIRKGGIAISTLGLVSGASLGLVGTAAASVRPAAKTDALTSQPTNTPASELRAALDELLREHVDLTANVVQIAVTKGVTGADAKAAIATLGQNTDELGAAIGSVYGKAAQGQFLKLWRAHIGFFVTYTLGKATKNAAMVAKAQRELTGYVSDFADFVSGATKLPKAAVAADLRGHVETLEAAINAIVSHSPTAGTAIQMAAMHMDGTAAVLAGGIVSSKNLPGNVNSSASSLRAGLTGLLIQHVADTGFVVQTAIANKGNLKAPEVSGAIGALATNTNDLGAAIGSVYGKAAQATFLKTWRAHIGFFVNYTLGKATKNAAMVATAQKDLNGYVASFSAFVSGATKLPKAAVAADLRGHISTLETAINDIVAGNASQSAALSMAESHMAGTAAVLAQGIVASEPSKFSS